MCDHSQIQCINPYELIRKYECRACRAVMMCSCDEVVARELLPHQTKFARPHGAVSVPVTQGFQRAICDMCRGLPERAFPLSGKHRGSNKLARFYWREIELGILRREKASPAASRDQIRNQVVEQIRRLHEIQPKYSLDEESEAAFLVRNGISPRALRAAYLPNEGGRAAVVTAEGPMGVEEFVSGVFRREGYQVVSLESRPFHVLFGTFMWLVIQDGSDPLVRLAGRGRPTAAMGKPETIRFPLPEDFGTVQYSVRRVAEIEQHLCQFGDRRDLLWYFDYWLEPSVSLREYLGAPSDRDVLVARNLIDILTPYQIRAILRYLTGSYWERYCGWPDLLAWRENEALLVEVKSSHDHLSRDQRTWIEGNRAHIGLPFELVKVHRARRQKGRSSRSLDESLT